MKYNWITEYAQLKKGATIDYKIEWGATRLLLDGKMFGMIGEDNTGNPIVTLKLQPENGEFMREKYEQKIVPGYYMNKIHWNSVLLESSVPQDVIQQMIDESYQLILEGFSKKKQRELLVE